MHTYVWYFIFIICNCFGTRVLISLEKQNVCRQIVIGPILLWWIWIWELMAKISKGLSNHQYGCFMFEVLCPVAAHKISNTQYQYLLIWEQFEYFHDQVLIHLSIMQPFGYLNKYFFWFTFLLKNWFWYLKFYLT